MTDDPKACYRALIARDRRFDGRFFVGVRTTGIYCRPVCPARSPRFANVAFYPSAAAAEEAGFRPCLRCRPEAAPTTPAWAGTSATVTRALRLLDALGPGDGGLDGIAARVGLSDRRLRELFARHLGASPHAVLQGKRLDFARKLLDETRLPITDVAFASGFGSVRRFNDAMKRRYGKAPRELRRSGNDPASRPSDALRLVLPYRPPIDLASLFAFLAGRAIPGVEAVEALSYRRIVRLGGAVGRIAIAPAADDPHALTLTLALPSGTGLMETVSRARTLFDLDADPASIGAHLAASPALAPVVKRHPGLRVPGGWDGFELAVRTLLGQQVSVKAATTLSGRLARAFGEPVRFAGDEALTHVFPSAATLAEADVARIGVPAARAQAIRALARAVADGEIVLEPGAGGDAALEGLQALPGIGPWTASYIAMRVFRDPDAFPASDLVLKRALAGVDIEAWRPWRAYAAMYLWKRASLAGG